MTAALDAPLFARQMARFAPFEPRPVLAVGVSGGADSLALVHMADAWARDRGGHAVALTVDHGLRPESAEEARQVAAWLADAGIAHRILAWGGPKPATGIQDAARRARQALLGGWCRANGVLHLLLAHHRGDQAETVALRREDRSGPDGLAGMALETSTDWGRILRPMLDQPKSILTAWLATRGLTWIEDPSNLDERHSRVRLRRRIAEDATEAALGDQASRDGAARRARARQVAAALAEGVALRPAGWARISRSLTALPDDVARAALARTIVSIGNLDYAPRGERLDRLLAHLRTDDNRARTLGGCRVAPDRNGWLVAREAAALPPDVSFIDGTASWDRFVVTLPAGLSGAGLSLGALGSAKMSGVGTVVPAPARPGLAAIRDLDGIVAVPHVGWVRPGADPSLRDAVAWTFPRQGLAGAEFAVV